jgi:hypothetical protein
MPDELAVDEAQCVIRLEIDGEMWVKVHRIIAADAEGAAAPGWPRVFAPEGGHTKWGPCIQRRAGGQADFHHITTIKILSMSRVNVL